jgi:hypothetical protein
MPCGSTCTSSALHMCFLLICSNFEHFKHIDSSGHTWPKACPLGVLSYHTHPKGPLGMWLPPPLSTVLPFKSLCVLHFSFVQILNILNILNTITSVHRVWVQKWRKTLACCTQGVHMHHPFAWQAQIYYCASPRAYTHI